MLASARSIVTVEEIVDELEPRPGGVVLPSWVIDAVCLAPHGAHPSYAHGYYDRDNDFYVAWEEISRDRETVPGVDGAARARHRRRRGIPRQPGGKGAGMSQNGFTADEMMAVEAARRLDDGTVCFVGIGLPEPRRRTSPATRTRRTAC